MTQGKSALNIVQKYAPSVRRVIDAKKGIEVKVLARDCQEGNRGKPDDCAMAKACMRDYDGAIISKSVAYLIKGNTAFRFRVPSYLRTEIVSFDRDHDFRPGQYDLIAPHSTEKLGWARQYRAAPTVKKVATRKVRRRRIPAGVRSL